MRVHRAFAITAAIAVGTVTPFARADTGPAPPTRLATHDASRGPLRRDGRHPPARAVRRGDARAARGRTIVYPTPYNDPESRQHFRGRNIQLRRRQRVWASDPEGRAAEIQMFGRVLEAEEVAALVGAPDGATVVLSADGGERPRMTIDVMHPFFQGAAEFEIVTLDSGQLELQVHEMMLERGYAGRRLGQLAVMHAIAGFRAAGGRQVRLDAADATAGMNGAYTWPAMGFNAALPPAYWSAMNAQRPDLAAAVRRTALARGVEQPDFNDVMNTPGGREYVRANVPSEGIVRDMLFDTDPMSRQSRVLDGYARDRGLLDAPTGPRAARAIRSTTARE
jgi:hypothetical protein